MIFSAKTTELISQINDSSDTFITNNFEVSALIDIAFASGKLELFNDLIFTSKYVKGLKKVLTSDKISGKDYIEKTYGDFNLNLQIIFEKLKLILSEESRDINVFFEKKYFQMSHESINNIMELAEDLSLCKEFSNKTPGVFEI